MPSDQASTSDETTGSPYNKVFESFVERPSERVDLVGLIAYSLYKFQKREWLIAHRPRHDRFPTEPELAAFSGGYTNSDARLIYRRQAESLLNDYASTYVDASSPAIREHALSSETLRQAQAIEEALKAKSAFWPSVWSGIVATALWTFLIAILAAALTPDIFRMLLSSTLENP